MDREIYNDPIIGKRRKGDVNDPLLNYTESLQIINGKANLTEVPSRLNKVQVSDSNNTAWYEIVDGELKDNLYRVDYTEGVVFFDPKHNSKKLTFKYSGTGVHFFPSQRVYYESLSDRDVYSVKEKIERVDLDILSQKNRVDQLIRSTPQPSEIVEIRVGRNGETYATAKARVDAEQKKIEDAYRDVNGKVYSSLNERINAEQNKIEESYVDKNGRNFNNLKKRIDAEQGKIEEAYVGADGQRYASLKDRHDSTDEKTASLKRRIVNTVEELKNTKFKVGEFVKTLGYKSSGDGGGAEYIIHNQTAGSADIVLANGLKAKLIYTDEITPFQFGAKGDGETDDTSIFTLIENSFKDKIVDLKGKTYVVSKLPANNRYANGTFKRLSDGRLIGADYSTIDRTGNSSSIYMGKDAGKKSLLHSYESATVGSYNNVGIGFEALLNNVKGYRNIAVGYRAMEDNVEGYYNVAIGDYALADNIGVHTNTDSDVGSRNTAIGSNAGRYNTTGHKNVYVGRNAGHASTTGSWNTAVGYNAYSGQRTAGLPEDIKTAGHNTMVGYNAGFKTNADMNTALGSFSLYANETGKANIAIGYQSNPTNKGASNNVTIGVDSMRNHTDVNGHDNTAVGTQALVNIKKGHSNTAIGRRALATTIAGNPAINFSGSIGIGANSRISGSYQCQLGNSAVTVYAYGAIQNRSDMRDKADVRDTILGLDFIKGLRPVDFKWDYRDDYIEIDETTGNVTKLPKDGSKKGKRFHHGLIAQEVKQYIDSLGIDFGGFQDHQVNGGEDLYTIGYEELIAPMIKAIQELSSNLEKVKSELESLKSAK
ncbi:tail fiber domain-containing protein [Siminovitchia sp. 179-K 8D1 HS]|uniref:tail fiber domain-containing protein n=1 Tax=Siminovitchia sp. 179-K 8D1 HS TaxID=3142385 RepID=UPI0039A1B723